MKTFLVNQNKKPVCKWGSLKDETFFEGNIPEGYKLAFCPSKGYVVIDVDVDLKNNKNGFLNIPLNLRLELESTYNYETKRKGRHYHFKYSGTKDLGNKTSPYSIDLRVGEKGYCILYNNEDIRKCQYLIKETSEELNLWLEKLFSYI